MISGLPGELRFATPDESDEHGVGVTRKSIEKDVAPEITPTGHTCPVRQATSAPLTAGSVIAVMPACMLAVPNPCSRSEWSVHCEEGIHDVRPFKFQRTLVNVVVWTIAAHVSRNKNEAAKQHH